MNFIGSIFLARNLSIEDYGFYGILFYLFTFIINFGDIGFAASIIRQKDNPHIEEQKVIFTAQFVLNTCATIIFFALTPLFCKFYKLPQSYSIYFMLVSISIFFLAFKTIPTVRMERNLKFGWLSIVEIIQVALYNGIAVLLSYWNYGPYSFCIALLVRTVAGSLLVNIINPFPIRFKFNKSIIGHHLKFGIPYQAGIFINLIKDSISPVIIGAVLGISSTGVVNMASTLASFPVLLLMVLNRLFFPAFSRAMDNKEELNFLFKIALRACNAFIAPVALFILIMCDPFIRYVVGSKWIVAKPLFYFLWTANLTFPAMMVSTNLILALGFPKTILKFNTIWMLITLVVGGGLVFKLGIYGFGIANLMVNILMIGVCIHASKYVNCNILKESAIGWIPGIFTSVLLLLQSDILSKNIYIFSISLILFVFFNVMAVFIYSYRELKLVLHGFKSE